MYLLEDNLFSVKKWKPVLSPHGNYSLWNPGGWQKNVLGRKIIENCLHGVVSKMGQVALLEPTSLEAVSRKPCSLYLWLET